MPDALEVELNRDGPQSIDVDGETFEASGDFEVVLRNHGASLHVHLRLDETLARAASISTTNHYVADGSLRRVEVQVDQNRLPVKGHLEIVTGYGAQTEHVHVSLVERTEEPGVEVDERLAEPPPRDDEPILDRDDLPVVALAAVALLIALLAGLAIGEPMVLAGVAIVLIGVAVAGVLLAR